MSRFGAVVRQTCLLALLIAVFVSTSAHVGTSNASFEGMAGPYRIRVIIRTPGVIPGLAQISVRVVDGEGVERITVRPLRGDVGLEGSPPPDTAQPVSGEPDLYAAELWLMTTGSYSVHVDVSGTQGAGTAFVPVLAVAEQRLDMHPAMEAGLLGVAGLLFVGALTVFGAAVRESVLPPGIAPDATRRRRALVSMVVGGLVLGLVCWGGWAWWGSVDARYVSRLYKPLNTWSAVSADEPAVLTLTIDDPAWGDESRARLIADHGKLMHMFLVKDDDLSAFAHIHPTPADSKSFVTPLPPLPSGDYRIYADIVHESGFAQTLVDTVEVQTRLAANIEEVSDPEPGTALGRDPDDSWAELLPVTESQSAVYELDGGRTVIWEREGESVSDQEATLRFSVANSDGTPAQLEPYMGMLSHVAVSRNDGSVFVHLHPSGSINMAAQMRFEREEGDGTEPMKARMALADAGQPGNVVAFPFVFPRPGPYRIFVQVKVDGTVETAVFDVDVHERGFRG